jgi:hypothetical protein
MDLRRSNRRLENITNYEIHNLYPWPNRPVMRMIKPRIRWAGHIVRIEVIRNMHGVPMDLSCS